MPFPESAEDFEKLVETRLGAGAGASVARAAATRSWPPITARATTRSRPCAIRPRSRRSAINKTQFFKPVPQAVWEFHIGGYQVLDKYLKSRKGRVLSLDEINHVGAIADSLAFTIEQMAKIDEAYQAAFPDRG